MFSTLGLNYSKVCGQLKGYQVGSPNGFEWIGSTDSPYVDGASVTYGSTLRKYIWTYACGFAPNDPTYGCPCNTIATNIPTFTLEMITTVRRDQAQMIPCGMDSSVMV